MKLKLWVVDEITWRETLGKKAVVFSTTLCPAMKYFIGMEVYHEQQISKKGCEMGFTAPRERA